MFKQFDYGKGLQKQLEGYTRLAGVQQQKRLDAMIKQYEQYAARLVAQVTQPGASNPGQMKNAAELLVDAAAILQHSAPAYRAFAELVARSRKVPVVPGLAAMVDRLLDLSTELQRERANLLSWRVVTGTMKPERYLRYLSERARLTDASDDWKDLAWGVAQLIKKGTLGAGEDAVHAVLLELHANRQKLGDQAQASDLVLAESLLARRSARQAEEVLMLLAAENKAPSAALLEMVETLLHARTETCWELHQLSIGQALEKFEAGTTGWTQVQERLSRARLHRAALAHWLVDSPLITREPRLAQCVLNSIRASGADNAEALESKLATVLANAGAAMPEPGEPAAAESAPGEPELELMGVGAAPGAGSGDETEQRAPAEDGTPQKRQFEEPDLELVEAAEPELELVAAQAEEAAEPEVPAAAAPDGPAEAEPGSGADLPREAVGALPSLSADEASQATELVEAEAIVEAEAPPEAAFADQEEAALPTEPPLVEPVAAELDLADQAEAVPASAAPSTLTLVEGALEREDFEGAYALASSDPDPQSRREVLAAIEGWLVVRANPTPRSLITLARVNRDLAGDPRGGFEAATTAALLDPADLEISTEYEAWFAAIPEAEARHERARQAAYLCAANKNAGLIGELVDECVWLSEREAAPAAELLAWLEQVRPVLDEAGQDVRRQKLFAWTRMYLQLMAQSERRANLALELRRASTDLAPQEALSLVRLLEAEIPADTRFEVECQSLLRDGRWQDAVDLMGSRAREAEAAGPASESLDLLYSLLPEEALATATGRVLAMIKEVEGTGGALNVIRYLQQRYAGQAPAPLAAVLEQELAALCEAGDEAALRLRLDSRQAGGDELELAADLLSLGEQGDQSAIARIGEILPALLERRDLAGLAQRCAFAVAGSLIGSDRQQAVLLLARTGQKTGSPDWARQAIQSLGGPGDSIDAIEAVGKLSFAAGDSASALSAAQALIAAGAHAQAFEVIEPILEQNPQDGTAHLAMLEVLLGKDLGDPATALQHAQILLQLEPAGARAVESGLARLAGPALALAAERPADASAQLAALCILVGGGRMAEATATAQTAVGLGPQASTQVLRIFERIALRDADLPSGLLLAWGRALVDAGRMNDALDRIAGLRESVEDYPEYIGLLEEIKGAGSGPGVNMQLGEAYLRVSLWQRAASEYSEALGADPGLAQPILTQLRSFGALEPNPHKYPLHLVALRAVGLSEKETDWGWALSALAWLMPRWNAEELYAVAQALWKRAESDDLDGADKSGLLLNLYELARSAGDPGPALDFLAEAWQRMPEPGSQALDAVQSFDPALVAGDGPRIRSLYRLRLEAAVTRGSSELVAASAEELATACPGERDFAVAVLRSSQEQTDDKIPLILARLRLVQADGPQALQEFVDELAAVSQASLSNAQIRELIHATQAMAQASPEAPEPQGILLQLFDQLGDQARLWQLGLWQIQAGTSLAAQSRRLMDKIAADEFALRQQVELIEVCLLGGDFEAAAAKLGQLDPDSLGELGAQVVDLAEAMYGTAADEAGRRWLCAWLRKQGDLVRAADHLVWAHAAGLQLPHAWLGEGKSGALLLRAARICEIAGDDAGAVRHYRQVAADSQASPEIVSSAWLRIAELAADEGRLADAVEAGRAVVELLPANTRLTAQVRGWETRMHLADIEFARQQPDTAERTLEIARHLMSCGEISEAINELQAGITRGQEQPEVYNELGLCFLAGNDAKLARRAFSEALVSIGNNKQAVELKLAALYGLAQAEDLLGNTEDAVHCLEQLLVIRHSYRDSRELLERLTAAPSRQASPAAPDATGQLLDEILSLLGDGRTDDQHGK